MFGPPIDNERTEPVGVLEQYAFSEPLPHFIAPDPGGLLAEADSLVLLVEPLATPVGHSPATSWSQGTPYPGPEATVNIYMDFQSPKWWGRMGQGQLVWSGENEFVGEM